jgi:hypothetical protein
MLSELWKRSIFPGTKKNIRRTKRLKPPRVLPSLERLEARELLSTATPLYVIESTQQEAAALASKNHPASPPASAPPGYSPSQISQAYGFNQISFPTANGTVQGNGSGQTIAIVDAYNDPNIYSNLKTFDSQFGLANPNFTVLNQSGQTISSNGVSNSKVTPPANNSSWAVEEALDVEWAHAMAPAANIVLIEANSASMSDLLTAVQTAGAHSGVSVVSMSWGGSEASNEAGYDGAFTAPGVTYVASSGDNGAPPSYPAVSPNVLAVGGTSLTLNSSGGIASETAWSGSGGGISSYEPLPSYQPGTYSNGSATGTSSMRMSPDVSYDADPNTGVAVYDTYGYSGWLEVGGTSAGAPQWSALIAIANQGRALAGEGTLTGATQTLPMIYQMPSSNFHDITSGSNGTYSAGSGYDLVTGRGTPIANDVVAYLVNGSTTSPPPAPPPAPPPSPPPVPSAPTGLTATAVSSQEIDLSWNSESAATAGFLIESSQSANGTYTEIGTVSAGATGFKATGLTPATTYYFEVFAVNNSGDSSPAGASATTLQSPPPPPSPPPGSGLLPDGNFSSPNVGSGYVVDPTGTPWTFYASAGVAGDRSILGVYNPAPPGGGSQVGFLSGYGSGFGQTVYLSTGNTYKLTFDAAQSGVTYPALQQFEVVVGNTVLGIGTPYSTQYTSYSTVSFYVTASGYYSVQFIGTNYSGGIALFDNVSLGATPFVQQAQLNSSGNAMGSLSGSPSSSGNPVQVGTASSNTGSQAPVSSNQAPPVSSPLPPANPNLGLLTNLPLIEQLFIEAELNLIAELNSLLSLGDLGALLAALSKPVGA